MPFRDVGRERLQERACYALHYIPIDIDTPDTYYDSGSTGMGSSKGTRRYVAPAEDSALQDVPRLGEGSRCCPRAGQSSGAAAAGQGAVAGPAWQKRMRLQGHTEGRVLDVAGVCRTRRGVYCTAGTHQHTGPWNTGYTQQGRGAGHRDWWGI